MDVAGRRFAVLGAGASGRAAARFLLGRGARVDLWDDAPRDRLDPAVDDLERTGARVIATDARLDPPAYDGAVVSPGIPGDHPVVAALGRAGVEVIGEVELAWRFLAAPVIAVTGTNGKTTVTEMVGDVLRRAGLGVFVGGNLGTPLVEAVGGAWDWVVAEVSSFQLDTAPTLRPRVAVLLNVTEDHLDRHGSLAAYRAAKARIFANQGAGDAAVVNADDPGAWAVDPGRGTLLAYSVEGPRAAGAWVEGGDVVLCLPGRDGVRVRRGDPALAGTHNLGNALAAWLAAAWAGVEPGRAWDVIRRFSGLPHRYQPFLEWRGIRFVDDSKATNVDAAARALATADGPVVWVAGGSDKAAEFSPLAEAARGRVRAAVLVGETAPALERVLAGVVRTEVAAGWPEAVARAVDAARPGDTVLLSPAAASFDRFSGYAERGRAFQKWCRQEVGKRDRAGR